MHGDQNKVVKWQEVITEVDSKRIREVKLFCYLGDILGSEDGVLCKAEEMDLMKKEDNLIKCNKCFVISLVSPADMT